jgi:signal transduction histidine kinase
VASGTGESSAAVEPSSGSAPTLALSSLLGLILDQLSTVVNYTAATVLELNGGALCVCAYRGPISQEAVAGFGFRLSESRIHREVLQRCEPVIIRDVCAETALARSYQALAIEYPEVELGRMRSWVGVPLIVNDEAIGILTLDRDETLQDDSIADTETVQAFASQVTLVLENARLFAEVRQRAEQQAVLTELGQALTARLDVDQVLEEAYRGASRLLDTSSFYIALYHAESNQVTFAIDVKDRELQKPSSTRQAGHGLTEYVIHKREPLLLKQDPLAHLRELGIDAIGPMSLSWLGVPLMVGERVLGVMAVQSYSEPGVYGEADRDLLASIANPVAIALQNAQLFEETRSRAQQLALVNRIASAATATLDLDELMATVYEEIASVFRADGFHIALYDRDANELDYRFRVEKGVRVTPERLPLGEGLSSIVVSEKTSLVIRNGGEWDLLLAAPAAVELWGSWLGVPILAGECVVGVISVQAHRSHAWGEEDQMLLFTIADQVAMALDNARLFDELESRVQELEALYQADAKLYRRLELDQVLQTLVDIALDILKAEKGSLMVWDDRRERLVVRVATGFAPETMAQMSFGPGEGSAGRVAVTGEPAIVEDTHLDPSVITRITEQEGIRSFLHMPIEIGGKIFGVFNVDYTYPRVFRENEVRLFMALAQRAAMAIETAQLHAQAQELAVVEERGRIARDLHDAVTQTLFSASLIAEVLPRIWEQDPVEGSERLEELRELTRGALAEMRALLLELRPLSVAEAEMGELLRQLADAVAGRARLSVALEIGQEQSLPPEVKVALYRIAQEALNNVAKHAHASQCKIGLRSEPQRLVLEINDNGRGFDVNAAPLDRLGLGIMRERAVSVGATIEIESQMDLGTRVRVIWCAEHHSIP